ncbi:MAG: hypothetical protein VXX85_06040 [Candidatus Margulisiibacteriota bacterium]|nr:hypothetical protein [Candidatus Margulisiibacteriota bacterium]
METVFISCGETSGDRYAAEIIRACESLNQVSFIGNGGHHFEEAGGTLLHNVVKKSTIGFIEPLFKIPFFLRVLNHTKAVIKKKKIKTVIIIDHQGFNIPLAKWCKANNIRVISFIAPQFWMWGQQKQAQKFVSYCDQIVCIFKKEYEYYKAINPTKVIHVDHPLISALPTKEKRATKVIGLFPGSRVQEIKYCLPIMLNVVKEVTSLNDGYSFKLAVASKEMEPLINSQLTDATIELVRDSRQLISESYVSLVASGTVSLEHAIIGTPCIVMYKFSKLSYFIAAMIVLKKLKENCYGFMALPNILSKKEVCPEFLQDKANPSAILKALEKILRNKTDYLEMVERFKLIQSTLIANSNPFDEIKKIITRQSFNK